MGSSHSTPANSTRATPLDTPASEITQSPAGPSSRPSVLRRLAAPSISRRDSKRSHESSSTRSDNPTDKRARNAEVQTGDHEEINFAGPSHTTRPEDSTPNLLLDPESPSPYPQPSHPHRPNPTARRSWLRRSQTSYSFSRTRPPLPTSTTNRSINRLSSFFGLSTPSTSTASPFPTPLPPSTPLTSPFAPSNLSVTQSRIDRLRNQLDEIAASPDAGAIPDLDEQITAARVDLEETERQLEGVRQSMGMINEGGGDAPGANAEGAGENEGGDATGDGPGYADATGMGGPIPAGAVLVIQGLAQAQVPPPGGSGGSDTASPGANGASHDSDRRSRGLFGGRRRNSSNDRDTVESQARMIGGLLT
jgi:hypothetical protein